MEVVRATWIPRPEDCLWAGAAFAVAFSAWRLIRALYSAVFMPFIYSASSDHLQAGVTSQKGRVIRNLPKGSGYNERPLPAFPNGWFYVDQSSNITRLQVRHISMLGLELAVFRDADGVVHALDAYCPHLGANLAVGGRVTNGCLECPFHGWQFRGTDGKCVQIPGAKKVPDAASTRSWRLLERNGAVLLWHHIEDREPDWLPPELDDYVANGFRHFCGRIDHVVYAHIQDLPENGADIAHFPYVHTPAGTLGSDMRYANDVKNGLLSQLFSCLRHEWIITLPWRAQEQPDGHLTSAGVSQELFIGKYRVPYTHVDVHVTQVGPGIVYIKISNPAVCDLIVLHYVVPEEPFKQRMTHVMFSEAGILRRIYGKIVLANECTMVERDVQIWNNKCYRPRPVFASSESDEILLKFRRWYSQFYSPSSDLSKSSASVHESLTW